jgi:hypothetical protein
VSDRLMPSEVLTKGADDCCLQCDEPTRMHWLETIPFCNLDCLDEFSRQWGEEM